MLICCCQIWGSEAMPNSAEGDQLLPSSVPHSQIPFRQGMGRVRRMKVRTGASEGDSHGDSKLMWCQIWMLKQFMSPNSRGQSSPGRGSWSCEEKQGWEGCWGWSCLMPSSVLESQSPATQRHTRTPVSNRIVSMGVTEYLSNSGWIQRPLWILLVSKNLFCSQFPRRPEIKWSGHSALSRHERYWHKDTAPVGFWKSVLPRAAWPAERAASGYLWR